MFFNSIQFLIFFPIVVLMYFLIPVRCRNVWLLICSYYFYMCWNIVYIFLLVLCTVATWVGALLIQKYRGWGKNKELLLLLELLVCFGILFFFKYYNWTVNVIGRIFMHMGVGISMQTLDVMLPVGISFYTFQAIGYFVDVYKGNITAEKSLLKYALFVSFFPQLVAGPIERSGNLLSQFDERHTWDGKRVKDGLLLMLWGLFMKIVIADRIAILVDNVYDDYMQQTGFSILLATALFAFQIYCDFGGYSNIAIGCARVLGFGLMDNFQQPYLAQTVAEFWRRWHISLTEWFRDYVYIPLGGNRKGRVRKFLNNMIVFLLSGLWHGANWHYVAWGGINGLYIVVSDLISPVKERVLNKLQIKQNCFSFRLSKMLITFVLVDYAWLFFRADTVKDALLMSRRMISEFHIYSLFDNTMYSLGLNQKNMTLLFCALVVLAVVDIYKKKNKYLLEWMECQNLLFRWAVYYLLIFAILIFGIYGPAYDASAFIYFQF